MASSPSCQLGEVGVDRRTQHLAVIRLELRQGLKEVDRLQEPFIVYVKPLGSLGGQVTRDETDTAIHHHDGASWRVTMVAPKRGLQ